MIEAYAIVSVDDMIADRDRQFPGALKNDADKRFFLSALDAAAAIALGRVTHEQELNSRPTPPEAHPPGSGAGA